MTASQKGKILFYPPKGHLLVIGDLHGNWEDFQQVVKIFHRLQKEVQNLYLLFLGDLIHGPSREASSSFYKDQSLELLSSFFKLQAQFPGRVHSLLGNHEYSHLGGPVTSKFYPNEARAFENKLSFSFRKQMLQKFREFPLLAVTPSQILFLHAAPKAHLKSLEELEQSSSSPFFTPSPLLTELLWSREATEEEAERFFQLFSPPYRPYLAVHGHDISPSGFERRNSAVFLLCSSFGVPKEKKTYLFLDLQKKYRSTWELREGHEIRSLFGYW